jgi:hypothetical protein
MLGDWQFRYQEFDELPYTFTLQAASVQPVTATLYDYISLTNKAAAGLNTSHRLQCSGTHMGIDLSAGVTVTNCAVAFDVTNRPLNEVVKVVSIGNADAAFEGNAADSGNTWVKILRAWPGATVTGQLAAIPTATTVTIVNSVARTNGRPFPPLASNGKYLYNAIEITRDSYGLGEHMNQGGGVDTFLAKGEEYLDLNYELCETRLMKIIERAILSGRRSLQEIANESEYETGGILEFIPAANYINFGGVATVQRINDMIATAFDTSGVRELYMFGGSTFTKALASAYEGKRSFVVNEPMSIRYGMRVLEIESTGRDGIVYYLNAPVLGEVGMDQQALILNLTEHNFDEKSKYGAFQIATKVPFADKPEDNDSYESNAGFMGKWREIYGAWGLIRRLAGTHFRVYGLTV